MPGMQSKDQFGMPSEENSMRHGNSKGQNAKSTNPKAGSFNDRSIKMPSMGDSRFKDRGAVNPLGAKKGNPSGM